MKIKYKAVGCHLLVKAKMQLGESVDERAFDAFSRVYLRGFLRPKQHRNRNVEFSGPIGISLSERMKKPISKRDFLFIIEQIVLSVQKIQANKLQLDAVIFDVQYVFINEVTKEVQLLYIPMNGRKNEISIMQFIHTVIYSANPSDEGAAEAISNFTYFINNQHDFIPEVIEKYILREDRSVVNTIKRQNAGQSGFMTSKQQHYIAHYEEKEHSLTQQETPKQEPPKQVVLTRTPPQLQVREDTEEPTSLLVDNSSEEETTYFEDDIATGVLDDETALLDGEDETALLDDEGTALLDTGITAKHPTLLRTLTNETIPVNKPVFRIGKERSYVDYFVTNNNAVSRSHADIITRGQSYFVIDLNSKNHTYINNQIVPIQTETEIHNGDCLRLGNEEFVFTVDSCKPHSKPRVCNRCNAEVTPNARFCTYCGQKLY